MTMEIKDTTLQDHHRTQSEYYRLPFMDADTGPQDTTPVPRHKKAKPRRFHLFRVQFELVGPFTFDTVTLRLFMYAHSVEQAVERAKEHPGYAEHQDTPFKDWKLRSVTQWKA